jgi:exodeoxyribonuclease VII large subunit
VGHETDVTLADMAADVRAPTPSAAAMTAVPDGRELLAKVRALRTEVHELTGGVLDEAERAVAAAERALALSSPLEEVRRSRRTVTGQRENMTRTLAARLALERARVGGFAGELEALSPIAHFARGYAVVADAASGEIISGRGAVSPGQRLRVRVGDGSFEAIVAPAHVISGE